MKSDVPNNFLPCSVGIPRKKIRKESSGMTKALATDVFNTMRKQNLTAYPSFRNIKTQSMVKQHVAIFRINVKETTAVRVKPINIQ